VTATSKVKRNISPKSNSIQKQLTASTSDCYLLKVFLMSSPKTSHASILLVDDNKLGLTARKHVLEELGYKTTTATSAHAAFDLFAKNTFDLIVTDYKMPDMSGITLIEKIRKAKPDVPVILISGFVDVLGLDEQTTGADIVMMKSNNEVTHLVRAVNRLLNRKPSKKPPSTQGSAALKPRKKSG